MRRDVRLTVYGEINSVDVLDEILQLACGFEDAEGVAYDSDPEENLQRLTKCQEAGEPMVFIRWDTYEDFSDLRATAIFGGLEFQFFEGQAGANNYATVSTFSSDIGDVETALLDEGTFPAITLQELEGLKSGGHGIDAAISRLKRIMPEQNAISVSPQIIADWRAQAANAPAT